MRDTAQVVEQRVRDVAGNVDGGDGSVTAAEDPVLHVLDVEVRAAEPVQDLREHADSVQVADRERGCPEPAGLEVDAVPGLARGEGIHDLGDPGGDGVLGLIGRGADVVGPDDGGVLGQP